jgi:hypothetical protein
VSPRLLTGAASLLLVAGPGCAGCSATADDAPGPAASAGATAPLPTTAAGLESLLVTEVPSGLPRVPDHGMRPPAGEKTIGDVAGYAPDADHQRSVLADYGYLYGWERFWRAGDEQTTVFVDQFRAAGGASSYADDLTRSDAEHYGGVAEADPEELPPGCTLLAVDHPDPDLGLAGPAAFSWCSHGVFTVSVAAVSTTPVAARAELEAVTRAQLDRLPRD